ncbi:MAG TPA: fused MFS/spermidine synthase [Solirubrobacteraceae bacterium]|nr:fused MFS/spermidine synthase [Solirubrobacteraceae bacterium]
MRVPRPWPPLGLLSAVVGAAALGTEIAAARLLAPYFGASTVVWANTIATVLVALSVGYWLGGRAADRRPALDALCSVVMGASMVLAIVPLIAQPFLRTSVRALSALSIGGFLGSLLGVLVLVAAPVALLGCVAPWALRLSVSRIEETGRVGGRLYALSTGGSLVGVFLAALVLVPFAGTRRTFETFALALALTVAPALRRSARVACALPLVLLVLPTATIKTGPATGQVIYETETPYQYARVVQAADGARSLELDEGLAVHSLLRPGSWLTGNYWDGMLIDPILASGRVPSRVAILGNAAGTTARAFGHYFPQTAVDAVELDGRLTDLGRRFFDLRGARLHTFTADARPYLQATTRRYDAILVDAYRQPYIPFYLATREFFAMVRNRLTPGGALVVNVGHPSSSNALERALSATIAVSLPGVRRDPIEPENTLLMARRGAPAAQPGFPPPRLPADLAALAHSAGQRLGSALPGGPVWTDDRAPVEWLIDESIVNFAAGSG